MYELYPGRCANCWENNVLHSRSQTPLQPPTAFVFSALKLLQVALWSSRQCVFWHSLLQYDAILQPPHKLSGVVVVSGFLHFQHFTNGLDLLVFCFEQWADLLAIFHIVMKPSTSTTMSSRRSEGLRTGTSCADLAARTRHSNSLIALCHAALNSQETEKPAV